MELKQAGRRGTIALVAAAMSVTLVLGGCNKQRYGLASDKAKAQIKQAREYQADKFDDSKDHLAAAEAALKSAEGAAGSESFKEALTQAQDAVKRSKEAVEAAKARYSAQQLEAAETSMRVASVNEGQKENERIYTEAEKTLAQARETNEKQKYEDSIEASNKVIKLVDDLLARLKNASENRLADLEAKLEELKAAKADVYHPNPIIKASDAIEQIKGKITKDRDYKQAIIVAGTAISDVEAAIVETKNRHSKAKIQILEEKLAEAIAEEAPIHTPEPLKSGQDAFAQILSSYYEKQYDTVLQAADALMPRLDNLITMARIESTRDKINQVEKGITYLKEQDVEHYLPGQVKAMEDLREKAQELFNNNDYEGAKFQAGNALIEQERIMNRFDAIAEKSITDAKGAVAAAQNTFDRHNEIFSPGSRVVDNRLEGERKVQASSLEARLKASVEGVASASANRDKKEFKKAIEQSKDAHATAEAVTNGVFRIVAQHTLVGIQDMISGLERQGARSHASRELVKVQERVERVQKLIAENQNREAAEAAATARAYVENVKQELARKATDERGRGDRMIRRLEGGAALPRPAAGGRLELENGPSGEFPGGSALNNKESMFEAAAAELAAYRPEPIVLAQTFAPARTATVPSERSTNVGGAFLDNRSLPQGTFMGAQPAGGPPSGLHLPAAPVPGAPSGAIIGTRPEPVVPTRGTAGGGNSNPMAQYEIPTGPGPFVALPPPSVFPVSSADAAPAPDNPLPGEPLEAPLGEDQPTIAEQVNLILLDDDRVRDIQQYEPQAVDRARQLLRESGEALAAEQYVQATNLAREAQRVILEAEQRAAGQAARASLADAASRINLARASSAVVFAPAQLTEAINLYEQAVSYLKTGDNLLARQAAAQAVIAADDARLFNVNKARDLASLSTRYGGYKAATPSLVDANINAEIAEDLLSSPETALQGQEVAKVAVEQAQFALDRARDFTFQERLDNIYKALNTALRAGANYFNVAEVKRLIAELAVARDEYCTRNFDAVELKLRDIEARLARVIETTPLVLEENLAELTDKLNALILAGAENYMAQEVDDVKSRMNASVIAFRKHDYHSSYTNLKIAMELTDRIENRLQAQVYFDAVTELFAQLDAAFKNFGILLDNDRVFIKKLISTQRGQPAAIRLTGRMNPNEFRDTITDIYLRAIHTKPPKGLEGTHNQVLLAIKTAKVSAENFQKLYIIDQLSMPDAYEVIDTAYNQYHRAKELRAEVQLRLIDPEARMKVIRAEKIVNY